MVLRVRKRVGQEREDVLKAAGELGAEEEEEEQDDGFGDEMVSI